MDKKIPPQKEAAFQEINRNFSGDDAKQQCARLLQALKMYSINTYEASRGLGVYHPPARVMQLRKNGYPVDTVWQTIVAENGDTHRVGCYLLRNGDYRHES
ncbi:helix-turn-helix domain-containing protein [Nitrosomonas oligotropha]|uniref:Helix-turn-helix domain-containing protein n=1 Tax=Nitrosomonas oligotropha TaxID=42354 RepID=A0A1H8ULG3_9PROT|nr:helix-turn-helix domain-containing protein [Nitrosomonas oligotropha]SDW16319.1 Helix-turn-helix domain-containing protein [Nitrosomonas oligotropha]SEP03813.1 Helix-turn-helix domain-containing protein [Nitrosomonas oligotropha]